MKGNVKVQSIRHESRHLEYKLIHNLYVLLPLRADTKQYPSMPVRSVCIYWCTSSGGYAAVSFFMPVGGVNVHALGLVLPNP